jgi:hypothetical protein
MLLMQTILMTGLTERGFGKNIAPLKSWVANFLLKSGFKVTLERPGQPERWSKYDAVLLSVGVYDWENLEHREFLDSLLMSRKLGQPRIVWDDDCYFKPWSLLKQAGFSDEGEFTHRLVLNKGMTRSKHFSKFSHWESDSLDSAEELQCPLWSCPPERLVDYARYDASNLKPTCYYAGYPKPDREEAMLGLGNSLTYGSKISYLGNILAATEHTAGLMLNSIQHSCQPTTRLYETASLSVQIWHKSVQVNGAYRRRVVSNSSELELLMDELSKQTVAQRRSEIELQVEQTDSLLATRLEQWLYKSDDFRKLSKIGD